MENIKGVWNLQSTVIINPITVQQLQKLCKNKRYQIRLLPGAGWTTTRMRIISVTIFNIHGQNIQKKLQLGMHQDW